MAQKKDDSHPVPSFTVYGDDVLAPGLVRYWAGAARAKGYPPERVEAALKTAEAMALCPKKKIPPER